MTILNDRKNGGINLFREWATEAGEFQGELCLVLQMYNPQNSEGIERCECYNEMYGQSDYQGSLECCPLCFGTTFKGGVRNSYIAPLLISEPNLSNQVKPNGSIATYTANFQFPWYVDVFEFDYVLRLNWWDITQNDQKEGMYTVKPLKTEAWQIQTPHIYTVKDGLGYMGSGQKTGSKAQGSLVNFNNPIMKIALETKYPNQFVPTPIQGSLTSIQVSSLMSNETNQSN